MANDQAPVAAPVDPAKSWWQQIAAWGLANSVNSNMTLTNAHIAKQTGTTVTPIPFGNINLTGGQQAAQQQPATGVLSHPLTAAATGGGLLAAGLLAAKFLAPATLGPAAPVVAPIVAPVVKQAEENIPLIIDWELKNAGANGQPAGQ